MKNFFKNQREILAIFFYMVLLAVLVYGVVFPLMNKIGNVKDKIQEEQIKQESSKKNIDELPKIQEQYKILENATITDILLDKEYAVTLIEKLESLAAQSGNIITITVQDQQVVAKSASKSKKVQEDVLTNDLPNENYLQFEIVLNGDFNTIGRFVKSLENFEYYCDIVGLQIRNSTEVTSPKTSQGNPFNEAGDSGDSQNKNGKLEATLDVVFYTE